MDKKKILIAEDDSFISDIYNRKFSENNYEVSLADNGRTALEKIITEKPDLVLLDILMPEMNGLEVLEKIRLNEATKKIAVIMLTNVKEKENTEKAMQLGANDYLVKASFTPQEVTEIVNNFFKK